MSNDEIDRVTTMIHGFLDKNDIDPLYAIITCASRLGWSLDITCTEPGDYIEGIAIGTKEYITRITPMIV